MSRNSEVFDHWVRNVFVHLNTGLEECYFAQSDRENRLPPYEASALAMQLQSPEKLRDLRMAADREDIPSRHDDLQRLRASRD